MLDAAALQFIQAQWFTEDNRPETHPIKWIVIHTEESPDTETSAVNVAEYFETTAVHASAHYTVSDNSIVHCVQEKDIAWAAPGANTNGIHIEHAGYAAQTADDWQSEYNQAMLKLSAQLAASIVIRHNIPVQWLSPEDLAAGTSGFTSHNNVTQWQNSIGQPGSHTDPGRNFPVDAYIAAVAQEVANG